MLRRFIFSVSFSMLVLSISAQYKEKMLVKQPPFFGKYMLKIIPMQYDSTVTDSAIINCIDTLPSYLFGVRSYSLMYKDDSTKLAITVNEHGMFRKKFFITLSWKNGNMKRLTVYKRHSKHYKCYNYYPNQILASRGRYWGNHKIGKWIYINTGKKKIRVEHYASDGKIKKTKSFKPPHSTFVTMFMAAHPNGSPYIVK